ncbi:unnamed protein product [Taenia asiatica]|uniref:Fibronectin type-III domain-containing protein n=1 Tax=Taenia asiatica TaxID=60517 RepID=A0A0R3VXX8_TAEAS|nr:unnamed protein product [Taenia asiatica]
MLESNKRKESRAEARWCYSQMPLEFKVDVADTEMVSLPKHFYWGYVDPESIELLWEVEELGECYADRIQMTAVTDDPFPLVRMESAQFSRGGLTLGDLQPNTTYNVTVEALRGTDTIFNYTQVVVTPPDGKPVSAIPTCTPYCHQP